MLTMVMVDVIAVVSVIIIVVVVVIVAIIIIYFTIITNVYILVHYTTAKEHFDPIYGQVTEHWQRYTSLGKLSSTII